MAGKKVTKKTPKLTLAEQLENNFKTMPAKILLQYRKDIATFKKNNSDLKNNLMKMKVILNMAQKKTMDLSSRLKAKKTPTLQKQLNTTKKSVEQTKKVIASITSEMNLSNKQLKAVIEKLSRFSALAKAMTQVKKPAAKKAKKPKLAPTQPLSKEATTKSSQEDWKKSLDLEDNSEANSNEPIDMTS
jgi:hypothetical protein